MKGILLLIAFATIATACGPRDVPVRRDGGGTVGAQSLVVLEADGERPSTCPSKFTDSVDLASPEEHDEGVLNGSIYAALSAGDRNCFRIGSIVNIRNKSKEDPDAPVRARVKVTKVEIVPVDKLTKSHAKALGMTLGEIKDFAETQNEAAKKTFNPKGMVNITFFDYVGNDSTPVEPPVNLVSSVYEKEGDRPQTCPKTFQDQMSLSAPEDQDEYIKVGLITATFLAGDRNCFRVGTVVNLQNKTKESPDAPIRAKLRVVRIEILPIAMIGKEQAMAFSTSVDSLMATVNLEMEKAKAVFNPKGMGSFTYFEYIAD